jgi:hypothetical protein
MLSATESLLSIADDMQEMYDHQAQEAALSINKSVMSVSQQKRLKRDGPEPSFWRGDAPETYFSLSERTLHGVASVIKARRVRMEQGSHDIKAPEGSTELARRRKAALAETNTSPLEVAFLFGYTDPITVRALRKRNGLNEHTGAPLTETDRQIVRKRAEQEFGPKKEKTRR